MKLIKASYEIITPISGEKILKEIELAARTCYKSEDKIEYENDTIEEITIPDKWAKSARVLIPKLISRGHEAMLEFGGNITIKFICDRGVSHELVRHRLASFAQESTRYCNYGKNEHIQFIIPSWCTDLFETIIESKFNQDNELITNFEFSYLTYEWVLSMARAEQTYNEMLKPILNDIPAWSPQQARSVLPNSLKTEINVSTNIREWRHILKLRTSNAAHPDMQYIMRPLLKDLQNKVPILFDDITY